MDIRNIYLDNFSIFVFIIVLFVLFNNTANGNNQIIQKDTSYYVELNSFYDGQGIVFSKSEAYYGYKNDGDKRISLTINEVIKSEIILDSLVNLTFKEDSLKRDGIKKKFRKYNRQYFGFETKTNDTIVVMFVFNFSNSELREFFKEWDKGFFFSTLDFYSENARIYWINLRKRKMEDGSWPLEVK